jgi:hypothetical protein
MLQGNERAKKKVDAEQKGLVIESPKPAFNKVKKTDRKFNGMMLLTGNE